MADRDPAPDGARRDQAIENETRRLLRTLIRHTVPPVPRKLNQVGELYGLCLEMARENGRIPEDRAERLTLLRLTILQLLAPDLFRFGRRNPVFLAKLEAWKRQAPGGEGLDLGRLEDEIKAKIAANEEQLAESPKNATAAGDLYSLKHIDQPLLARIRSARQQRSDFDPLRLVDPEQPSVEKLAPFFSLDKPPAPVSEGLDVVELKPETDSLDDPDGFLSQLFSTDPLAWRNALAQEADNLTDRILDRTSFSALLDRVRSVPEFVQMDWLELIAPHLSAEQLFDLYKESRLLTRIP